MGDRIAFVFEKGDPSSPAYYRASQTAVLLLDFHNLFLQKAGGERADKAAQQAMKLRKWAKEQGILVVHCLVNVEAKPFRTCKGAARLSSLVEGLRDHPEQAEEPEGLKTDPAVEPLLVRIPGHVSALKSEGFEELMKGREITSLILCGLSTSGCVMRTAFSAADAEYVVTVIEDACADPKDGLHETLVENVLPARSHCCRLEQFTSAWEQRD